MAMDAEIVEATFWRRCLDTLQTLVSEQDFNTWIRPLQVNDNGRLLILLAPNRFVVDWVNEKFLSISTLKKSLKMLKLKVKWTGVEILLEWFEKR